MRVAAGLMPVMMSAAGAAFRAYQNFVLLLAPVRPGRSG